jgi:hypothetical protein
MADPNDDPSEDDPLQELKGGVLRRVDSCGLIPSSATGRGRCTGGLNTHRSRASASDCGFSSS